MAVQQRLSMVTLGVADVTRSTRFYESLGWRRSPASQASITFFVLEGSALALYQRDALAADAVTEPHGSGFRAVTLAMNYDSPADVDAVFAEWVAAGATPVKQPQPVEWGGYSSYVADLDGHLWEIAHNPYAPNGPDGRMQLP